MNYENCRAHKLPQTRRSETSSWNIGDQEELLLKLQKFPLYLCINLWILRLNK